MARTLLNAIFSSVDELIDYQAGLKSGKSEATNRIITETINGTAFNGKNEEVINRIKSHDLKEEARLNANATGEIPASLFQSVRWEWQRKLEEGDEVCVSRYLDGQDCYWTGVRRRRRPQKVMRVYVTVGGNCFRSKEELAVAGAVATTVTELLESNGVATELWGVSGSHKIDTRSKVDLVVQFRIKGSQDYCDYGAINFLTGNNHFFRNIIFRTFCKYVEDNSTATVSYGLGTALAITQQVLGLDEREFEEAVVIPPLFTVDEAVIWLKEFVSTLKDKAGI